MSERRILKSHFQHLYEYPHYQCGSVRSVSFNKILSFSNSNKRIFIFLSLIDSSNCDILSFFSFIKIFISSFDFIIKKPRQSRLSGFILVIYLYDKSKYPRSHGLIHNVLITLSVLMLIFKFIFLILVYIKKF